MILNYEQIKQGNFLDNVNEDNFGNASYDLRAGKIITMDGEIKTATEVRPQEMVVVVCAEEFNMDKEVVGYTTVKNSLSVRGVMAVNVGIVDPGYKGPISSILINFGKENFSIEKGTLFLRITFHKIAIPNSPKIVDLPAYSKDQYIDQRKLEVQAYLDEKFLTLDSTIETVATNAAEKIKEYQKVEH